MITKEQVLRRNTGIGGSDAKTIASGNLEDWHELWLEKTGQATKSFNTHTKFLMALGNAVEPVTLNRLSREVPLLEPDTSSVDKFNAYLKELEMVDPDISYLRCNLDALTKDRIPVEVKYHTGNKTIQELMDYYAPQLQHNMLISQSSIIIFAVTFGRYGNFSYLKVKADPDWQSSYVGKCGEFWDHVVKNTPPVVPTTRLPQAKQSAIVSVDMSGDNAWADQAHKWITHKPSVEVFKEAEETLKSKVPPKANIAFGNGIVIKRARNNRLTIKYEEWEPENDSKEK
jgi:predicted phage-related endonuclease